MPTIAYPTFVPPNGGPIPPEFPEPSSGTGSRIRLVPVQSGDSFENALDKVAYGLVIGTKWDRKTAALVDRLCLAAPDAHLVLALTEPDSIDDAEALVRRRLTLLSRPTAPQHLVRPLRTAWFEGRVERLRLAARSPGIPAVVRCAVLRIFKERIVAGDLSPGDISIGRTLSDLAALCGTHPDTLRRARQRCGIDPKTLMRGWTTVLALHLRFIGPERPSSESWSTIARSCGYESESGLRRLTTSQLGTGLRGVTIDHLAQLLDRMESALTAKGGGSLHS